MRVCWNAQSAFYETGLDHDAENPLFIPATVTTIGKVSERASLLHCAASRAACAPVCLCRAAGLSLSLTCMLSGRQRSAKRSQCAELSEASWIEHIYILCMRVSVLMVHARHVHARRVHARINTHAPAPI